MTTLYAFGAAISAIYALSIQLATEGPNGHRWVRPVIVSVILGALWPVALVALLVMVAWGRRNQLDPFPRLTNRLIEKATGKPFQDLYDSEGQLYMGRFWLYNEEWHRSKGRLSWLPAARIHYVNKSDLERHLHDHPWFNISIPLRGCYLEVQPKDQRQHASLDGERPCQKVKMRLPYLPVFRKCNSRHRLVVAEGDGCWSLFIMFKWQQRWGFYTPEGKIYYRDYLGLGPKEEELH